MATYQLLASPAGRYAGGSKRLPNVVALLLAFVAPGPRGTVVKTGAPGSLLDAEE
jgi:hypothetical protein